MTVISIVNQKGGVGKTTTAVSLAYQLGLQFRTLLIDLDAQGNATSGFSIDKNGSNSVLDLNLNIDELPNLIKKTNVAKLFVIPASPNLIGLESVLANVDNRSFILSENLKKIKTNFDYIIIDCPPSLGIATINSLASSDYVIIPVQGEYYSLEGLSQLLETFAAVKEKLNPGIEILGVLMTLYDKRTTLNQQVREEVSKYFGDKLFKTVIPRNIRLAEAPSHGMTIFEYDKWSKGAKSYKNFVKEVLVLINNK